jgi:hypothetical protein
MALRRERHRNRASLSANWWDTYEVCAQPTQIGFYMNLKLSKYFAPTWEFPYPAIKILPIEINTSMPIIL